MTNQAETWPDFYTLVVVYTERLEGEGADRGMYSRAMLMTLISDGGSLSNVQT